jgi:hypothetical protein
VCVGGENSRASLAASLSARAPGRGSLRAPDAAASAKTAPSCAPMGERDETCPVSTEGWTRRVHFVREEGGGKTAPSCAPDNGSNGRSRAAGERSRPPAGGEGTVAGAVGGRVGRVEGALGDETCPGVTYRS